MQDGFRIGIHDAAGEFRLKLEGRLGAAGLQEAEWCWRTGSSTVGKRRFVVDVLRLAPPDAAAADLLRRMREGGAEIVERPGGERVPRGRLPGIVARLRARLGVTCAAFLHPALWRRCRSGAPQDDDESLTVETCQVK